MWRCQRVRGKVSGAGGRQGGGCVGQRGGRGGVAATAQGGCGDRVGGGESGPDANGQSSVAGAGMEGEVQGGGRKTPVVALEYDVASGQRGGGPAQERVGRGAARTRTGCGWHARTVH